MNPLVWWMLGYRTVATFVMWVALVVPVEGDRVLGEAS